MENFKELSFEEMQEIDGGGRFWKILGALALGFLVGFAIETIE